MATAREAAWDRKSNVNNNHKNAKSDDAGSYAHVRVPGIEIEVPLWTR